MGQQVVNDTCHRDGRCHPFSDRLETSLSTDIIIYYYLLWPWVTLFHVSKTRHRTGWSLLTSTTTCASVLSKQICQAHWAALAWGRPKTANWEAKKSLRIANICEAHTHSTFPFSRCFKLSVARPPERYWRKGWGPAANLGASASVDIPRHRYSKHLRRLTLKSFEVVHWCSLIPKPQKSWGPRFFPDQSSP